MCVRVFRGDSKCTFLANEGQGPGEDIHEVGQPVGVRRTVKLPNVHDVILIFQHSSYMNTEQEMSREDSGVKIRLRH